MPGIDIGKIRLSVEVDDSKVKSLGQSIADVGKKGLSAVGSATAGIGKMAGAATAAVGAAATAAATAVTALASQSLEAYGQFEQLEGGVEKLFKTEEASAEVMQNASNAYKDMGLSANEYLDTATQLAASMTASLGGDTLKSAEQVDKAMKQMADNASVFGTDMEQVQTAYKGFAKDNYTALDNLKLGYGGSREEMERLLADAKEFSGIDYDISSYSDIVDAIQVVQDQMGITGNAAEEASKTIEGSVNSTKAAYENLITGLMDSDADVGALVEDLVDSAMNVVDNAIPLIENLLDSVSQNIPTVIDKVISTLNETIPNILPGILDSALDIISSLGSAIIENIDPILDTVLSVAEQIGTFMVANIGPLITGIINIITKLIQKITDNIPGFVKAVGKIIVEVVKAIAKALPDLVKAVVELLVNLGKTIWDNRDKIIDKFKEVFAACKDAIKETLTGIWESVKSVFTGSSSGGHSAPHRTGLSYVPRDGYVAELHRGEMVLTRAEAERVRKSEYEFDGPSQGECTNIVYNITVPNNNNALDTAVMLRDMTRQEAYNV